MDKQQDANNSARNNNVIPKQGWSILAVLSLLGLFTMYTETMVIPSITDFNEEFDTNYNTSSLILTCYLISGAIMTPIAGKLSDVYGRKKIMLIIIILYLIGTIAGLIATTIHMMIFARLIQGIGIAMFPIAFGIIRDIFPEKKLSIGQGIFSSAFYAGSVIGLPVGALIIEHFGWRLTFLSLIPIIVILIVLLYKVIPHDLKKIPSINKSFNNYEQKQRRASLKNIDIYNFTRTVDLPGSLVLSISIISLIILFVILSNESSFIHNNEMEKFQMVVYLIVILIGSILLFIWIEKRSKNPLIEISLLRNKILLYSNIVIIIVGISTFLVDHSIPVLVRSPEPVGFNENAITVANVLLPFSVFILVTSLGTGFLIAKIGNKIPTVAGSIILTMGFTFILLNHDSLFEITISLSVVAVGLALLEEGIFNIVLLASKKKDTGAVMSVTVLIFLLSMSIGPVISGYLLESKKTEVNVQGIVKEYPASSTYNSIFLVGLSIAIATVILSFVLRSSTKLKISKKDVIKHEDGCV